MELLENQVGQMKKLLDQKNSEIKDINNKNNDLDDLLKQFQSRTGKVEERFLNITQQNETVVELKNEIEEKHKNICDIFKNGKDIENKVKAELKAVKDKTDEQEKFVTMLADKIAKNSKEIKMVYNGNYSESDTERDIVLENVVNQIEIQDDTHDNTSEELLDQTFLNPSSGFNCNDCNFVLNNKSGLKKHKK